MDDEIRIHPLQTSGEMKQVEELQQLIWPGSKIDMPTGSGLGVEVVSHALDRVTLHREVYKL